MRKPRIAFVSVLALAAATAAVGAPAVAGADTGSTGFREPIYVDDQLAGSEGFVIDAVDPQNPDAPSRLVYATHEGTTLFYRTGASQSPVGDGDFASTYRNQVNLWTSTDDGKSWQRANFNGTGFFTNPAQNSGFSDPDITQDGDGNVYITGIDLVNDALVSSPDRGATWPTGTAQCHEGDRPWLAGGPGESVFMADNPSATASGHIVVRSTDGGATCSSSYLDREADGTGYGKIVYDPDTDTLWEAATKGGQVGAISFTGAMKAFDDAAAAGTTGAIGNFTFHPIDAATFNTFWKAQIAQSADVDPTTGKHDLYVVWTTQETAPNRVMLATSRDGGDTWTRQAVRTPDTGTAYAPWVAAGTNGRVAVSWYEFANPATTISSTDANNPMFVKFAMVDGANTDSPTIGPVIDPMGTHGPVHQGPICTSGTTCVASPTGDRRLGEFFTIAPDKNGCVMIATGDTMMTDSATGGALPTARGLYTVQDSGTSLTGEDCAVAHPDAVGPELPETSAPALAAIGAVLALCAVVLVRRRRAA
ncbi:MAG TPA: sialidase family protein [Mycobacteriales bacterium]|nr:sialidase family protein [Mycobacteriales bacterium]